MQISKATMHGLPGAGHGTTRVSAGGRAATPFELFPSNPKLHAIADSSRAAAAEKSALASLKALLMKQAFEAMLPKGTGTAQHSHLASDAWRSMLATSLAEKVTLNAHTTASPRVAAEGSNGAVAPSN